MRRQTKDAKASMLRNLRRERRELLVFIGETGDASTGDVIVQVAIFGEIVYG